jgi:hypothetical protein
MTRRVGWHTSSASSWRAHGGGKTELSLSFLSFCCKRDINKRSRRKRCGKHNTKNLCPSCSCLCVLAFFSKSAESSSPASCRLTHHTCRQRRNTPLRCISVVWCLSVHLSVPGRQARRSTKWAVVGFSLYSFAAYIWAIKRTRNQPIRWIDTSGAGGRSAVDRSSRRLHTTVPLVLVAWCRAVFTFGCAVLQCCQPTHSGDRHLSPDVVPLPASGDRMCLCDVGRWRGRPYCKPSTKVYFRCQWSWEKLKDEKLRKFV